MPPADKQDLLIRDSLFPDTPLIAGHSSSSPNFPLRFSDLFANPCAAIVARKMTPWRYSIMTPRSRPRHR